MTGEIRKCIFAAVCAVLFSGITFWLICCQASEIRLNDALGIEHTYNIAELDRQNELIRKYDGNAERLCDERDRLTEIYNAALFVSGNPSAIGYWSDEIPVTVELRQQVKNIYEDYAAQFPTGTTEENIDRLKSEISCYDKCISAIERCNGYGDYVRGIADNAENMLDISIYSGESWHINNIIKTKRDYYALEGLELQPANETGFMAVLCFKGTEIAAAAFTAIVVFFIISSLKTGRKRLMPLFIIWLTGMIAIYLICYIISANTIGFPAPECHIQSLNSFRTCRYPLSCKTVMIISVIFRIFGFALLLFCGVLVFSLKNKITSVTAFVVLFSVELFFSLYSGENRTLVFFREVNIFSAFSAERFFLRYLNLDLFTEAVSPLTVFLVFFILFSVVILISALKVYTNYSRRVFAKMQREYYDEIDRRYDASRKFRHDINNHLLALQLLIENGDISGSSRYIGEISESLDKTIMPIKTGSDVADALLCGKSAAARDLGLEIEIQLECPIGSCGISDYDLCGIFGNILDNAVEAAQSAEDRVIKLFIGKQHNMLYISCENEFSGELKRFGNSFLTTKSDFVNHGLGISRVREIARSNGGEVRISAENHKFIIEILLNAK